MIRWKRIVKSQDWLDHAQEFVEILVTDGNDIYSCWFEDGILKFHPDIFGIEELENSLTHWVAIQSIPLPNKFVPKRDTKKELLYIDEVREI